MWREHFKIRYSPGDGVAHGFVNQPFVFIYHVAKFETINSKWLNMVET